MTGKGFKAYLAETERQERLTEKVAGLTLALEHQTYKRIPGTQNSFRVDPADTNTKTQRHAHVYAKPNGGGKQLYSVNVDGSGHDGSSGRPIPAKHADYFRSLDFAIPATLVLESIDLDAIDLHDYEWCVLEDEV